MPHKPINVELLACAGSLFVWPQFSLTCLILRLFVFAKLQQSFWRKVKGKDVKVKYSF